jgi:hypothetical protein
MFEFWKLKNANVNLPMSNFRRPQCSILKAAIPDAKQLTRMNAKLDNCADTLDIPALWKMIVLYELTK